MNAISAIIRLAGVATTAVVLTFGVRVHWHASMEHGYRAVSVAFGLVTLAHADDGDGGDGGDGGGDSDGGDGGGDSGDGDGGDSDGGDGDGPDGDSDSGDEGDQADVNGDDDDADEADADEDAEEETEEETEEALDEEQARASYDLTNASEGDGRFVRGKVLGVAVTPAARDTITRLGAKIVDEEHFPALGMTLTHIRTATGTDAARLKTALNAGPEGLYGFDHAYRLASTDTESGSPGRAPLALLGWADRPPWCGAGVRIGLVDTAIARHELGARRGQVTVRRFAAGAPVASEHGTAVATLLLGAPPRGLRGALPAATVLAADVYRSDDTGKPVAVTSDLIAGLNWLVKQNVPVINMSLAGPRNPVLQRALSAVRISGTAVVAAAGNRGPFAPPAYPAAYWDVVAVTAINEQLEIFPRANRGVYIDLAAPGVDLQVTPGRRASGTSLAAVYVSAALADALSAGVDIDEAIRNLLAGARDLGPEGWDPTYGYGLVLRPLSCPR